VTFLLNNATPVQMQGRGAGEEVPTFWRGISAGFSSEYIRTNANAYAQDSGLRVREETARSIQNRLGMGEIVSALQERDDTYGAAPQIENMEDVWGIYGADTADVIFDLARRDAEANPDAWSDVDLSNERIEAQVTERLTQEYRDAQDMLDMMGGGGRMAAEFAGAAGAAFADLRQAILLPFGFGSGSIIKTVGREAVLGAAGEAITLPSQYAMAERLGLQDPNVVQQLAFAATISGAFGGAMEAGGRALTYFLGRQSVPTPSARGEAGEQFIIGAAEDAIARGESPFPATERALAGNPPMELPRAPLVLTDRQRVDVPPYGSDPVAGMEPDATPEGTFRTEWQPVDASDATIAARQAEIDSMEADLRRDYPADMRRARPFAAVIRAAGGVRTTIMRDGQAVPSWAAAELASRGITPRTHPGLFNNRTGHADLDNLGFDEDLMQVLGRSEDGHYANRDRIIEYLEREAAGERVPMSLDMEARMAEIASAKARLHDPEPTAHSVFLAAEPRQHGLFLTPSDVADAAAPEGRARVRKAIGDHMFARQYHRELTMDEIAEITDTLLTHGGDVDDAVARFVERELQHERSLDGRPKDSSGQADGGSLGEPRAGDGNGQAGSAGREAGAADGASGATERTAAGEQYLAPGIAPVSQRERLEALQRQKLAGQAAAADHGLFDLSARSQMDWLDAPSGAKADPVQAARTGRLRAAVEAGDDPTVILDGKEMRLSEALDELDADDALTEAVTICSMRGGA